MSSFPEKNSQTIKEKRVHKMYKKKVGPRTMANQLSSRFLYFRP